MMMGRIGNIATIKHWQKYFSVFWGCVIKHNVSFTKGGAVLKSWISTLVGISFDFSLFLMIPSGFWYLGYQVNGDDFGPIPKKLTRTCFRGVDSETRWELTSPPPFLALKLIGSRLGVQFQAALRTEITLKFWKKFDFNFKSVVA
jgi:hypothetical protein